MPDKPTDESQAESDEEAIDGPEPSMVEVLTDAVAAAARRLDPESRMAVLYRIEPKADQ